MKQLFFILYCSVLLGMMPSCTKRAGRCHYVAEPPVFMFIINDKGKTFSDEYLKEIKLSYFKSNQKFYIKDLNPAVDVYANHGILVARSVGNYSGEHHIKTYYIEYPGDSLLTDTLFIDYETYKPSNGCQYTLRKVKFNNQIVFPDTLKGFPIEYPVYIFNKRK